MQAETLIWNPIVRQYLVNAPYRMNRREGRAPGKLKYAAAAEALWGL